MNTREIIEEVVSLPVEERALIADSILRSLNQPEPEIDKEWIALANTRLADLRSGKVTPVKGLAVFEKVLKKYGK